MICGGCAVQPPHIHELPWESDAETRMVAERIVVPSTKAPHVPDSLPLDGLDYGRLMLPVSRASAALAAYDARLRLMDNPARMLAPLATQEAVLSSRIEGTLATLEDVLAFEAGQKITGEKANDIREILNYRQALEYGAEYVREMRLSRWLIRQMHQTLLDSVRGVDKTPGQWRNREVIIAPPGSRGRQDALYVPPSHELVDEYLGNWEEYLGREDQEPLVQTAIMHAQFEIIHPFLDGNGRVGRLLIPLYLYQRGVLHLPMFYVSGYLEMNRDLYYLYLRRITEEGDWTGWIEFFLEAVRSKASEDFETVTQIDALREQTLLQIEALNRGRYARIVVRALFTKPYFQMKDLQESTGMPRQTAREYVQALKSADILDVSESGAGSRSDTLVFSDLVAILNRV